MKKNSIFCCIFNHNKNENSKLWANRLTESGFNAVILDSGSDEPLKTETLGGGTVVELENVYYGGLFTKALEMCADDEWLLVVCDDILIDKKNFESLVLSIKNVIKTNDIGLYQPSTLSDSHNIWFYNINRNSGGIRDTANIEGWMFLVRKDVLDELKQLKIDFSTEMKFGWGIDVLISYTSLRMGYRNVVDDAVIVKHPKDGPGYDGKEAQKEMIGTFAKNGFEYNNIVEKCSNMKKRSNNLICCLFNYKHDDNSKRWFNILSPYYDVTVIDTFHKENGGSIEGVPNRKIEYLNNVYWGGSYMKAYEILCKKNAKYLLTIDTDIEITDSEAHKMIDALKVFEYVDDIGVYTGTLKLGSKALGSTSATLTNCHLYNCGTDKLRAVHGIEGWLNIMKKEVMDDIFPHLSYPENKYGWGVPPACIRRAIKRHLRVVADDRYEVYHPAGVSYNNLEAQEEENRFKKRYFELDCILPEEEQKILENIKA